MSRYTNVKINISQGQIDKIKRAVQAGAPVSIRLAHSDLSGEHVLALTSAQVNKMAKAYQNGTGVTVKMSKTQLIHNAKIEGGFIGALLPMLATAGKFLLSNVLPTLATGLLSGVGQATGSTVVNKIAGNGISGGQVIYLKKGGRCYKIGQYKASGLYLKPFNGSALDSMGEGLYLKNSSGGFVNGSGLITGDSQISRTISQIPIIGPILGMII